MKRLLIVADHSLVVQAIRMALRQTAGFHVVGFVDGRHSIGDRLAASRADVVLVDDMQNPEHPLERLREIADELPDAKTLLLTTRVDAKWFDDAFEAGAEAVISKAVHPVALGTLVRETVLGRVVHRPRQPKRASAGAEACPLTVRELQILQLAAQGFTNNRIAQELWVTEQTVKFHLSNTYRKLGVANRTEASRYAHMNDLVAPYAQLAS
ncbi:MAG TPA: response regulator transcription factor [Baekduia sp.]|uniref:response regulator transcription factor n=1 Tax=Baekduia sp. TaxID=2600305 RepID=UPI002B7EE186|nr:response regulator transcription factor [Baekduia sp.]HMJ36861.1 response regulator transcription factor [Baekduia sp.]